MEFIRKGNKIVTDEEIEEERVELVRLIDYFFKYQDDLVAAKQLHIGLRSLEMNFQWSSFDGENSLTKIRISNEFALTVLAFFAIYQEMEGDDDEDMIQDGGFSSMLDKFKNVLIEYEAQGVNQ